ncbi:MAG: CPBP family intramembrane glutamic endopeptidase [Cyanobacteria bacterium J06639_14]
MGTAKDDAFNLIMKGTLLSYGPLTISNFAEQFIRQIGTLLPSFFFFLSSSLIRIFPVIAVLAFIGGYILLVKGCLAYAKCKGYSSFWGWLGLLNWLGLIVLLFMPSRSSKIRTVLSDGQNSSENPFRRLNIPEILSLQMVALPTVYLVVIGMIYVLQNKEFSAAQEDVRLTLTFSLIWSFHFIYLLFRILREIDADLKPVFGFENNLHIKDIVLIAFAEYAFTYSFNPITLYGLSFIFPGYVEDFLNEKYFTNLSELGLWAISAIFLAPILEEFLYRGLVFQKWMLKWGLKRGILASSLLFAIVHIRFDILPLVVGGIFLAALYVRTSNLLAPILCHALYNAIVVSVQAIAFLQKSVVERDAFISLSAYQDSVQMILGRNIFLSIVTVFLLLYLLKRIMPRRTVDIPYLKNRET